MAASAALATGLWLEPARFEVGRELCWLDAREPDERDDEARLVALEPDPFLRRLFARELPARVAAEAPLLDRVEPDRREGLELDRLVVDEFLVCWGMRLPFLRVVEAFFLSPTP